MQLIPFQINIRSDGIAELSGALRVMFPSSMSEPYKPPSEPYVDDLVVAQPDSMAAIVNAINAYLISLLLY